MCCGGGEPEEGPVLRPQGDGDERGTPLRTPVDVTRTGVASDLRDGSGGSGSGGGKPSAPGLPSAFPNFTLQNSDGSAGRKRKRRLYCKTGFDLAIFPNGKVEGTKSPRNKYGMLEYEAVGFNGEIRIKGIATGFYVTMTPKGKVHAQPLPNVPGTIWVETRIATGMSYMSLLSLDYAHHGYYLAIKKSGKPKLGPQTNHPYPQKSISFLPSIVED